MSEHAPTAEQEEAVAAFRTGRSLAIEAGAGAGKTSTLVLIAEEALKQRRRGQYIAFNKAIVVEAGAKMPSNVNASTAHSLAWKNVIGRNPALADRLRTSQRMKSTDIASRLGVEPIRVEVQDGTMKKLSASFLAGLAMRGVTRFCQSADREPAAGHVPYVDGIDVPPVTNGCRNRGNNDIVARALVPAMRRAWADLTSDQGSLPFKHDHYLKMWHLSGPRINADFILFDEAQDANPVLVDIVRQQEHAQLVWVGDSQQQIYSFTGALNALQQVGAEQTTFLTRSFRFGPEIADIANDVLTMLDADLRLTGTDSIPSRVEPVDDPDVILCRTNATAVRNVLNAIAAGKRPHLVGGGREVVDFAKGAQRLMRDGWTDHPELACFSSWGEVQLYVDQDEQGGELRLLVKLIEEFTVETIIDALERMPSEDSADVVVSTAHKSKGREWAAVQLADDFPSDPAGEELRLLYVAVTRAKRQLDITAVGLLNGNFDTTGTLLPETEPIVTTTEREPAIGTPEEIVEAYLDGKIGPNVRDAELAKAREVIDFAKAQSIIRRHELPVPFANGYAPELGPPTPGDHEDAERLQQAYGAPHTVAEHLAGVEGNFSILGNGGRTGRQTNLGSYDDSRKAIEAASALYGGGAFSVVTVIDEATGELVVQYDA